MIAPFILAFLIFGLYPIINTLWLAFTNTTLMNMNGKFIGFANFQLIFQDEIFWDSTVTTWIIWLLNFLPQLGFAMLLSVWLTSSRLKIKAVGFWRAVYYLPNLLMPATVAVLYFNIFSFYGPANQILVQGGMLEEAFEFFRSEGFTRGLVAFIQWWMWFGNTIVILVAGMTSISNSLYESAMMDGASGLKMFTKITLPCLKPVLIYNLVTSLVGGMQMFDIPYMLTDGIGSPNRSIMTVTMYLYRKFKSSKGHIGQAAAVGFYILVITIICTLIIFYVLGDKDERAEKKFEKQLKKQKKLLAKKGA